MEKFLSFLQTGVDTVNSYLSDWVLVILLIGVGLYFTIRTKFVQVRCFGEGMKNVFGKVSLNGKKEKGGLSSFQAFTTAVAAQVGTGNIIGVSGAILAGGPGAIFWMWVIAFFGMATIYAEAVLAQKTKMLDEKGNVTGGPVYYIKKAFNNGFGKFLAGFFAVAIVIALGFAGSMVQSNSISGAIQGVVNNSDYNLLIGLIVGFVVVSVSALIFIFGVKGVAGVTEKIVPIMAILYIVGGIVVLCFNIKLIPETFGMIFKFAFAPQAVIGGGIGYALKTAISKGAQRGLFSNEAGMGSTPHAHALANVKTPHEQGTVAMAGVFIDTFVVLTMTALIVISSLYAGNGPIMEIVNGGLAQGLSSAEILDAVAKAGFDKTTLVQSAIASTINGGSVGNIISAIYIAICLTFFAFSTIISWNLFGKINFEYLFGKKAIIVYLGSVLKSDLVWSLTDFFNYLMVLPNAIALIKLGKMVVGELNEHDALKKTEKLLKKNEREKNKTNI